MNVKIILALLLGIIVLVAGALFLATRNSTENTTQNQSENSVPNIPAEEFRRFIIGASKIPGYTVAIENERDLIEIIQTNHIYGRTFIHNNVQTTGDRPLENITFLLTDERPDKEPEFGTSDYVYLSKGTMQFNFVITPEELSNPEFGNEILRKLVAYSYRLSYPNATESEVEEAVDKAYNALLEKNPDYFVITKK